MPSLWPWKNQDSSPASFEKALSNLAAKISKSQTQLDAFRQQGRRVQAIWTLYTSFAYLLCFIILFLVVGRQNLGAWEYTVIAATPLLIYLGRALIKYYYGFRIEGATRRLEEQISERAKTIDQLKAATRYDSTQELLHKYGDTPLTPPLIKETRKAVSSVEKKDQTMPHRTGGVPPPTANISRLNNKPPLEKIASYGSPASSVSQTMPSASAQEYPNAPEFASNAFSTSQQDSRHAGIRSRDSRWYDRLLDVLLGDDETSHKNLIVLICQNCRLVNGRTPPGVKSLVEIGTWRCSSCGSLNGEEDEGLRAMSQITARIQAGDIKPSTIETKFDQGGKDSPAMTGLNNKYEANKDVVSDASEEN